MQVGLNYSLFLEANLMKEEVHEGDPLLLFILLYGHNNYVLIREEVSVTNFLFTLSFFSSTCACNIISFSSFILD